MESLEPLQEMPRTADEDVRRAYLQTLCNEVCPLPGWVAAFPVTIKCETRTPVLVVITARETVGGETSVQCSVPSFVQTADGVRLQNVAGLTAGTRYDVTAVIFGVNKDGV